MRVVLRLQTLRVASSKCVCVSHIRVPVDVAYVIKLDNYYYYLLFTFIENSDILKQKIQKMQKIKQSQNHKIITKENQSMNSKLV